jgi:hypothetical protein
VAEGAALEMPCTGNCAAGSNPAPSAINLFVIQVFAVAVLDGEVAVPCSPQSAPAGLNSLPRVCRVE